MNYWLGSHRRVSVWVAVAMVLLVALAGSVAQAAVVPWDLTTLTLRADLIVYGRIVGQFSRWDGQKGAIHTRSTLAVREQIKGNTGTRFLAIETPGGVVGDIGLMVLPAPRFARGEEVLVFLAASPEGGYRVVGSLQGKYAVRQGWALNDDLGIAVPLVTLVRRILGIMEAHGIPAALSAGWESRFPMATAKPPPFRQLLEFRYLGYHWPGPEPMGEPYLVNVNTTDVPSDQALQAVQAAADTWTNVDGADFEFVYGGTTTATDASNPPNGKNEVLWKNEGHTGVLGTAWFWYRSSTKEIFEADMVINDYYNWDTSGAPTGEEFDLQSVVLHEFGHFLHLGHDDNPDAVMYPAIAPGVVARTLHTNDIAGIQHIYPMPPPPCLSDFDGDGTVELTEIAQIAGCWRVAPGDSSCSVAYDLNGDQRINIVDIMIAAGELNGNCGS
jgi:hypothetical protein